MQKEVNKEYLRRNLLVAKATGAQAGVQSIFNKLQKHKRPPLWLIEKLIGIQERLKELPHELAQHRDELWSKNES